jgi:hypothetical protein
VRSCHLVVAVAFVASLIPVHRSLAGPPAALVCHKNKLAAMGKFTSCLSKARGKAVVAGGTPRVEPCIDKLVAAFTKAETKAGGDCHVVGDASAIAAQVGQAFLEIDASLVADGGCFTADPGMCGVSDPTACPDMYSCMPGYLSASLGVDACYCYTPPGLD